MCFECSRSQVRLRCHAQCEGGVFTERRCREAAIVGGCREYGMEGPMAVDRYGFLAEVSEIWGNYSNAGIGCSEPFQRTMRYQLSGSQASS